ncbi:MAG: AAA family ATPase [Aphanocapsa sp. GSE-SYN-MK-11-07L]|jgi:class 3 adenylate cyclase/predicted ATPase|nr:AAA family ATPase [Aphanocapsa sp. GSE-SYN-MK-11-07L]
MQCPDCKTENPDAVKFCNECGTPLKRVCSKCSYENVTSAKFCSQCATRLEVWKVPVVALSLDRPITIPVVDGERKIVTALFADIKNSMDLMVNLDAEEAQAIVDPTLRLMGEAVRSLEGYVVHTTGDGIYALFGAPAASHDHPRRAIYAALEMQRMLRSFAEQLAKQNKPAIEVRVGINTGEVVVRTLDTGGRVEYLAIGHAINFASRLQIAAPPGSIAIGERTRRLVDGYFELLELAPMSVKGISDPIVAYEVTGLGALRRHLEVSMRRGLSKFVGREREMHALHLALDLAISGQGQIVAIITEAGTGKSRLLFEFSRTLPLECKILEAFALSHGKAMPWMPVIDMLQNYFDIRIDDSPEIRRDKINASLTELDPSLHNAAPYLYSLLRINEATDSLSQMDPLVKRLRSLDAIKRIILAEALKQPLILMFEDLHWIDAQTRLLLNLLADSIRNSRILLLVTYRPEYDSDIFNKDNYTEIKIDPLNFHGAEELLSSLLPNADELSPLKRFIIDQTGGNPFFMEEIVRSLFEDGTLINDGAIRLTKPLGQLQVPPTIQGTIAERIDKLPAAHKEFLQTLAVLGVRFQIDLIFEVCSGIQAPLDEMLTDLKEADFIYPQPGQNLTIYLFKHVLTQEVAYNSLLTHRRKSLHEHVGQTIELIYAEKLHDHVSQLAYHYSRTSNTDKAIEYLGQAGEIAIQRSAHVEAAESLNAAIRLLDSLPDSSERVAQKSRFWLALGVSLQTSMGYAASEVGEAYEKARELSERCGDRLQLISAVRGHSVFSIVRADYETVFRLGETLKSLDDGNQEYSIEYLLTLGLASLYTGQLKLGKKYFLEAVTPRREKQAIETIQYAGHSRAFSLSYFALNMWYLGYPDTALKHSEEALNLAQNLSIPITMAQAQGMYGLLCHTRREYRVSEEWIDKTVAYAAAQGFPYWFTFGSILKGWLIAEQSNNGSGIIQFEDSLRDYRASGARIGLPWFLALRAEILAKNGQIEEGLLAIEDAFSGINETDERYHEAELHRLKGELLLTRKTPEAINVGESCFQRSLKVASSQKAKSLELRAATSLASLCLRQGRFKEGVKLLSPIYGWFTEGFDTPDLMDARRLLDELFRVGSLQKEDVS